MSKKKGCFLICRLIPVQELSSWLPLWWVGTLLVWITWTLQGFTGGFQEINQTVGAGKSGLKSEEQSQFSLNSCLGQAGASCSRGHRNNLSSWQLQESNPTNASFKKGNGKFGFTGPVATGLNLGKREYSEIIITFLVLQRLPTELEEKFFLFQVCLLNSELLHELGEC